VRDLSSLARRRVEELSVIEGQGFDGPVSSPNEAPPSTLITFANLNKIF
jgi:hypothetical protein